MSFVFPLVCGLTLGMYIIANVIVGMVRCVKQRGKAGDLAAEADSLIEDSAHAHADEAAAGE